MRYGVALTFLLILLIVFGCKEDQSNIPESDEIVQSKAIPEIISFNYHVRPILSDRCFKCHGPDKAKIEAGLSLNAREDVLVALGDKKDHYAIVPGDIINSVLIDRIYEDDELKRMPPPASNLVLAEYEKEILKRWIEQGAKWEQHWSFNKVSNPPPPSIVNNNFVGNDIDNFILSKVENNKQLPSQKAKKEHLIRRISLDLTGLPPSFEDIQAYVNDNSDDAYETAADNFLNSDAYAENMTGLWLDVARYADTHGYQDDLERTMWPWRDWVIHAFKKNMPYDQFVEWQLAGDLLPNPTREQLIATGFNRNHKITQEGGVIPEEYRVEYVNDRTMTFGKAFIGLTVECAKCHDHKYDPISQKEYYSLYSFFNNVPEKGLIEEYGATPEPYMTLTKEEIESQLTFIKNLDTLEEIKLMVMEEDPTLRKSYILSRGAYDQPTGEVTPTTPVAILPFDGYKKNRKGLSDWLFNKENPLTSRVMVNRLWLMCFGKGLVSTPDDLGSQGSLPSHPELLDHLAFKFMAEGWDIKAMLKYIVMSNTYQQSSKTSPSQHNSDPENMLYARGSRVRLSAEKIRDLTLKSSGLLVDQIGGPSVKPYQPEGLWKEVVGGGGGANFGYEIDKGDKQYRRSLYTFWKRTVPPPDMMTFDAVTRDFCMVSRETTSTPLQALVMMNSPQVIEASRNLAYQAVIKTKDESQRISFMFQSTTSRKPNKNELDNMLAYLDTEKKRFKDAPNDAEAYLSIGDSPQRDLMPNTEMAAYATVANMIYNLDESITRS
ncbi:MAG: hypothetical protein ACJA1A_000420 [Saprospiraceae bacterium]|jgi:hypothetical protein